MFADKQTDMIIILFRGVGKYDKDINIFLKKGYSHVNTCLGFYLCTNNAGTWPLSLPVARHIKCKTFWYNGTSQKGRARDCGLYISD